MRTRRFAVMAASALLFAVATCRDTPHPIASDISSDAPDVPGPFASHTSDGTPVLVGASDIAACNKTRDEATAALLDGIPGTVIALGDNAYNNGSATDYANCYEPSWGRHKGRTHPVPGERDYKQPGAAAYFAYFGDAAGDPTQGYYSYDLGGWHIVALNSGIATSATSPQVQWLQADLTANTKACVLAYWHHPLFFSTGSTGTETSIKPLWDVLYQHRVEVVLNGHKRWYERFGRQNPAGQADPQGIREFIVGTGGAGTNPFGAIRPNSEVRQENIHGVLKLTLQPLGYQWEFVPRAGFTFTDNGSETCHEAADLPTANPGGPYSALTTVQFDGSGSSDPQGDLPLTYAWDFGDGSTGTGVNPSHTYAADGVYTVTLVVTDALGNSSPPGTTTATITGYAPPVANPGGPYTAQTTVQFDGSGSSDPQGDVPLTYAWAFGDGATGTGVSPSHTYAADGVYTVSLVVTDSKGNVSAPATTTATINGHAPPVANPGGPYTAEVGAAVAFNGTGSSDPQGDLPLTYAWDFGDGSSGTGAQPSHAYAAVGGYTVTLVVTDSKGNASAPATTTATIVASAPPIANPGGPYSSDVRTIQFNGSGSSDPQGDLPLSYAWNFGDGATGTGVSPSHTYAANGQYTVTLVVTDSKGNPSAPATTTVTLTNVAPVVNAGPDQTVQQGNPVSVSVTFSDPGTDDAPWSYAITWGDGSPDATGSVLDQSLPITASHVYSAAGTYTVTATVTDRDGGSGADNAIVTVQPPGTTVVLLGAGDISTCSNNRDELTAQLLDQHAGTVFTFGDNAYPNGTTADYTNCYEPTWGRHKARTWAAIGNHEYGAGNANGTWDYFGDRAGPRGKGYYSFDLGDWHIIVLNDNKDFVPFTPGTEQELWLRADLAANTKLCTLAIWHQPRFLSSNEAGFTERFSRKVFWDDLYAAGADLVLNGHQHHYERFAPMTPDGVRDDARGIRELIVGTGGESIELPTVAIHPNSELRAAPFGIIKLVLSPSSYTWEFIPMQGVTFTDSGSGTCH